MCCRECAVPAARFVYKRREPERTDLHRLVRTWFPLIPGMLTERFGPRAKLARFQTQSVERYVDCGQLANGFVRFKVLNRLVLCVAITAPG